ncbi:MAG: hypothetical protein ACLPX5_13230 [Dissulfurispiraceae bacterium]
MMKRNKRTRLKPKRRKGGDLKMLAGTDRDTDIARYLSSGAASVYQVQAALQKMGHQISLTALRGRLAKLVRHHYLECKRYGKKLPGDGAKNLYVLSKTGGQELLPVAYRHNVRRCLPAPSRVRHDLKVTEVVHKIKKDCSGLYFTGDYKDKATLRDECGRKKIVEALPDLRVNISFERTKNIKLVVMNIVVDHAAMTSTKRFMQKLQHLKGKTLWLFSSAKRMENIRKAVLQTQNDEVISKILLALRNDFIEHGFRKSSLVYPSGHRVKDMANELGCDVKEATGVPLQKTCPKGPFLQEEKEEEIS